MFTHALCNILLFVLVVKHNVETVSDDISESDGHDSDTSSEGQSSVSSKETELDPNLRSTTKGGRLGSPPVVLSGFPFS